MPILTKLLNGNKKSWPVFGAYSLAGDSHVGKVRMLNEDAYMVINHAWNDAILMGIADGMGGHEGGEIASYLVVRYLLSGWNNNGKACFDSRPHITGFLTSCLSKANYHIYRVNSKLNIRWKMGTTATIAVLWRNRIVVAQIGDSRCYRFRSGKIKQLTDDQNWRTKMMHFGGMTQKEADAHPRAHTLTNCIGTCGQLRIAFYDYPIKKGDRYLVCSDGLSSLRAGQRHSRPVEEQWDRRRHG
jgi:protein phosphatase